MNSPHKGPVMWKASPCHGIISLYGHIVNNIPSNDPRSLSRNFTQAATQDAGANEALFVHWSTDSTPSRLTGGLRARNFNEYLTSIPEAFYHDGGWLSSNYSHGRIGAQDKVILFELLSCRLFYDASSSRIFINNPNSNILYKFVWNLDIFCQ